MEQIEGIYDLCVFKGCPNKAHVWGKALFPFPHSTNPIFETWLENCGNKSIIGRSQPGRKKFGLCSDHFTPDSFYDEDRRKLRRDAVPEPYSPTFKRSYPLTRANAKICDHNYALVSNDTENALINYKRPTYPLRINNARSYPPTPPPKNANNNQGTEELKKTSVNPRPKRGRPLYQIYSRNYDDPATDASCSIETEGDLNSTRLEAASRLAADSKTESSMDNILANRRGRRAAKGGNKVQGRSAQGPRDGEVGILQETNAELRAQNKLLRKLNWQLKLKMKRCEERNSMLKIMLEKVSSVDGFLDFHRCMKRDVRNFIKEEIHKCKTPVKSD